MDFAEMLLESIATLAVNKMRTVLAVLGIVIGIGSVIALLSLGQALSFPSNHKSSPWEQTY